MSTNQRAQSGRAGRPAGADGTLGGAAGTSAAAAENAALPQDGAAAQRMAALSFPADKDYLALARTTAMHIAGLLDLPISRVTDLRLAVDEACTAFLTAGRTADRAVGAVGGGAAGDETAAGVLATAGAATGPAGAAADEPPGAADPGALELRYDLYPGRLCVSVRAPVPASWPEVDELGWTMLQALVSEVRTEIADGIGTLTLVEELPPAPAASPDAG